MVASMAEPSGPIAKYVKTDRSPSFDRALAASTELHERVNVLEHRLTPVLHPEDQTAVASPRAVENSQIGEMAADLEVLVNRLGILASRVDL
jgi:hypothetical protein